MPGAASDPAPGAPDEARPPRGAGVILIAVAALAVLSVGAVTWFALRSDVAEVTKPGLGKVSEPGIAEVGHLAPDFELETLDGGIVRLSAYRGTPLVVNFWASWCTPCRAEFPLLRDALHDGRGTFALIGVDTGDIRGDGRAFAEEQRARWPNGFDVDRSVAKAYGVVGLPHTFFIRADGTIAARVPAELTEERFAAGLAKIT